MASLFSTTTIKREIETFFAGLASEVMEKRIFIIQELRADHQQGLTKDETRYEQRFNSKFFGDLLGYEENIHRHPKASTPIGGKIADVGLGRFPDGSYTIEGVQVIVELKGSITLLERKQASYGGQSPVDQGFGYKTAFKHCPWLIVTNFASIRLYRDNKQDFELWTLEELASGADDWFALKKLLVLLHRKRLVSASGPSRAEELLSKFRYDQATISKKFYQEYKTLRLELINDMRVRNPDVSIEILVEKAQKLIDRTVFVHFCEDKGLLPPDKLQEVIDYGEKAMSPTFQTLTNFFEAVNRGSERLEIPHGYNGGLFQQDPVLDSLHVGDAICRKFVELGKYNFDDELSVNILGHIFEQSISDLEQLKITLLGEEVQTDNLVETQVSKRKKDGIFYTPEYIVDYIVQNSLMTWLEEQETLCLSKIRKKGGYKTELEAYQAYHQILQNVKVLDPACGSGAFLVKVFDKLLDENKRVGDMIAGLAQMQTFFDMTEMYKTILRNNIYGVDLNEESVEITKLSLWLKSAEKGKKLNNLDANIKCGNSLIDDPAVASDKAFKREEQFPTIFQQKRLETYMITRVTHNTRVSERMVTYGVQTGEPVIMDATMECAIARHLNTIIEEEQIRVLTYNICKDHVHMLIVCSEDERDNIVKTLKGKSTHLYKKQYGITQKTNLRAQKYHRQIAKDEEARQAMCSYITDNRMKHNLPMNKGLQPLVTQCLTPLEDAYAPVYTGGFDVVVGNPPYVLCQPSNTPGNVLEYFKQKYEVSSYKIDLFHLFYEKSTKVLQERGKLGFITPNTFLTNKYIKPLRKFILDQAVIDQVVVFDDGVFVDASVDTAVMIYMKQKQGGKNKIAIGQMNDEGMISLVNSINQSVWQQDPDMSFNIYANNSFDFSHCVTLGEICSVTFGLQTKDKGTYVASFAKGEDRERCLTGRDLSRYFILPSSLFFENNPNKVKAGGSRNMDIHHSDKIVVRQVGNPEPIFAYEEYGVPTLNTMYSLKVKVKDFDYKYLLAILNSLLIKKYRLSKFSDNKVAFPKIKGYQLQQLPIKNISLADQQPFIDKADTMLSLNKVLYEKLTSTLTFLQQKFTVQKLSTKLQKFYDLDFSEFKKQLGIKKLSMHDEEDLMHRFTEKKQDMLALKAQIDETDHQIDEMVFDLYGLTEEERAIVRGG